MSFLKLLAPFQQPDNYHDHLTALPWLWGSSCSTMPLNKSQGQLASNMKMFNKSQGQASNMKMFNFAENLEAQRVAGVGTRGRCAAKPGLLAPLSFPFLWNSCRIIFICMHASICAFLEASLLPLLQGLSPMEKRKMWLRGNSNEFLQIAFV